MKVVRGQAATFVTSCRRPRRGSDAVAAAKAHEVLSTYRDSLVLTSESDCAAVGCCTFCSATSLPKVTFYQNFLFGNKLAEGHGPPELPARSSVRRRTRTT